MSPSASDRSTTPPEQFHEQGWTELISAAVLDRERLLAVAETGLVESETEEVFDRLTQLASTVLNTPWAFVTVVDDRRSFWKSCFGTGAVSVDDRQNPVEESFCQYVVATGEPLLIGDARLDSRTRANPSITSMGVIAWAGSPVRSASGEVLGTFCVVSDQVRDWTDSDAKVLDTLAAAAASEIQLRTALRSATTTAADLAVELAVRQEIGRRSQLMAELGQELSAASATSQISNIVSTTGCEVLGALFLNIYMVDPATGLMATVHSPTVPADIADRYRSMAVDRSTAPGGAIVEQTAMFASTPAEFRAKWPDVADDALAIGVRAASAWPLFRSDGSVMGALSATWSTDMEFGQLHQSALSTLSQMSAAALERGQVGEVRNEFVVALQHALLPQLPDLCCLDVAARYLPANSELGFGGDWYDIFAISPTVSAVIVGDVCGHGIQAAATMAQLSGSINALVRLNVDSLETVFDQAESWLPGPADFVGTVAIHLIDTASNTISYVSAGHPPSVVVHRHHGVELLESGRRPVLGIGGSRPIVGTAPFEVGSFLVAFTDGLLERPGKTIDEGIAAVVDIVLDHDQCASEQIALALEQAIDWVPTDDVAFAIVKRNSDD